MLRYFVHILLIDRFYVNFYLFYSQASEVQAFVDLARESDALREWKLRRASLRPVPLPSSMNAAAMGDDDGRATAPQEWIEKQQRLRQVGGC